MTLMKVLFEWRHIIDTRTEPDAHYPEYTIEDGSLFIALEGIVFEAGTTIKLCRDDHTRYPLFQLLGTKKSSFIHLNRVEPLDICITKTKENND